MSTLSAKEIKEKYLEYLNLNYVKSQQDPEEEPYKSKYEARKIIEALLPEIEKANYDETNHQFVSSSENSSELKRSYDEWFAKLATLASGKNARSFLATKFLEYNLSRNLVETEEIERGEKILSRITQELDHFDSSASGFEYNPLTIALELSCLNELIFVWSGRGDYKRCLSLIETVEEIYRAYKTASAASDSTIVPFDTIELIELDYTMSRDKRCANFESLYTHSLFYFAQVYGKLDEKEKSANYCQATLQRQMDEHLRRKTTSVEETQSTQNDVPQPQERVVFNPLDWATHAAAISQYYQCEGDFPTARHCLCCAQAILDKLNEDKSDSETLKEQTASIKRCWGKYAIEILKTAKRKLIDDSINSSSLAAELDKVSRFRFQLPESEYKLSECEKTALTSNLPLDFDQARAVFLKAQTILNETKEFFKLDGYVTDHCEILRDLSDLYAALIFFECDLSRKCKMHKRRLDLLEPVCDEISEQFYLTLKRQLLFDCGSILSEMIDIKIEIFKEEIESKKVTRERTEEMKKKINQLIENSLKYFDQFLTTMKIQPEKVRLPEKFDDANIRPALLAKFYIGRLHSKFIVVDPAKKLEHMKQTLDNYSYLVDYCDRNKEDTEHMINEYNVCKEMVFLLPKEMEIVRMNII